MQKVLGKGYYKPLTTIIGNVIALLVGLLWAPLTIILDTLLLLLWVIPEKRIEQHLQNQ